MHSVNWNIHSDINREVIPTAESPKYSDSYAQVESLVLPNSRGGLKPGDGIWKDVDEESDSVKRPSPLTIRLSEKQKKIIKAKAQAAGISVNRFVLASALGSDYRPPANRELTRALLRVYRELNAQGNNLNQIARQLNAGLILPAQEMMLDTLVLSLQQTLGSVREVLGSGNAGSGS